MANNFTFFGQFGGVTRQCALCKELVVVHAASEDLTSVDSHHLWSSAFEKHILERHSIDNFAREAGSCATVRIVM